MSDQAPSKILGIISDTHGLLRPEVLPLLKGCDLIIHAGDVGDPHILDRLGAVAPVVAVRGNVDDGPWADALPESQWVTWNGCAIYVLHNLDQLDLEPRVAGVSAVVTGHTHRPLVRREKGVLFLNPGSVGPRRFRLPVSLARVRWDGSELQPELTELNVV